MAEQQSPRRAGRKFAPVRADTEEYKALVTFLRKRMEVAGMTVRALAETDATGLGRAAISERLAGAKLDGGFVTAIVEACTAAPELRPRRTRLLAEGLDLLARAENRRTPVLDVRNEKDPVIRSVAVAAQARTIELYEELRLKNNQLESLNQVRYASELALRDATGLASVLSVWVVVLADEVEHLTRERELTMAAIPPDLPRLRSIDSELTRTIERHDRTSSRLARTEQDRQLATALLAEAMTRTREIRRERGTAQLPGPGAEEVAPQRGYGDDVDVALERAEALSRTIADRLRDAVTALDDGAETLPLSTVDNADNGPTSTDATDNPLWWDVESEVPTAAFTWAEETAVSLPATQDPADPSFEALVRKRQPREVMLLADRLLAHGREEVSVRLRTALALSMPTEELARLVLVLTEISGPMRAEQGAEMLLAALLLRAPSDVLALTVQLADVGEVLPRLVRSGITAFVRRPRADVADYLREQLGQGRRLIRQNSLVIQAVVREWPTEEILALVEELEDGDDEESHFVRLLFSALPRPPLAQTELLLHLWTKLPSTYFGETLPGVYQGDWKDLADAVAALHREWPPPLDRAARELAAAVMPLIIRGESLAVLNLIADELAAHQLSPERIFEPYRALLAPELLSRPADKA
ncbi:hypothetical protein R6V09_09150 [Streptomyces sp. W16]|uniref:hypothetical protein n=1 Tax=Streptomyces sp. W16 TaxID=3076631 RepID=UPI00295AADB9|nr:hypothetical protein [Streptomyces sp. W16]MDV9170302.1 hypothetical protein [Streptomyces sp. W16]